MGSEKRIVNRRRDILVILLSLLVTLTAAAEDSLHPMGCRRGKSRPSTVLRRGQHPPEQCGGDFYHGTRHQLVVLTSFKDRLFGGNERATLEQWEKIFNAPNLSEAPFYGSIHDYFYAQSYGDFDVVFDLQYVQLADSCKKYRSTLTEDENSQYMVDEALDVLLTRDIDWSLYDWNGDGYINQLLFVYAGKGSSYGGFGGDTNSIWPHQWRLSEHLNLMTAEPNDYRDARSFDSDGVTYTVDVYCAVQERDSKNGYGSFGTICHEYTHCFGFPDFYDGSTKYVGKWDLMDYGNMAGDGFCPTSYSAHERWMMGWLTPIELTGPVTVTDIPPLSEEGRAYLIRNDDYPNEYYIVENRQRSQFDAQLPGTGVTIFHIDYDESLWTSYYMMPNNPNRLHYSIFPANNKASTYYLSDWAYPYQDNISLTDSSLPPAQLWHPRSDNIFMMSKPLTNIAVNSDGLASFDFMKEPSAIQIVDGSAVQTQRWYDLLGRQLPDHPLQKGLYFFYGRKIVVR